MGANVRCEKNSLSLLSSKRTKAFSRTRADEAFALPSFSDAAPTFTSASPNRSGRGPKVEHCSDDVERLKQTMLQHESMFKEQLYELHRLYQVQRLLMEESQRKGSASRPRSDSPSSNSSLLYNPDSCKPKGETRFWDTKEASKSSPCKQLSFFPGLIDMNKPHEDKSYAERPVNVSFQKDSQRPIIDLEQPAEEHIEIEVEEEKPLARDTFLKTVGNSHTWGTSWQALQYSTPSEENADIRSISMRRESLGSTRRSLEDSFIPELSRHKEVPFFPLGPNKFGDSEANLCRAQALPVASLFGVRLNQENTNREKQTQAGQNNLEEKRKEPQIFRIDACCRSTGEPSKLPHWLLQGSPTILAKTSPVPAGQNLLRQHQTLPFVLQKHDEKKADSIFDDRVCSVSPQELSSSWPKSGTRLQFGESFLRAPQGKPSSGYFLDASRGNVQGLHKLAQTSSLIESMPFVSHSRDERGAGGLQIPATGYTSSPTSNKQSPVYDAHAAPAAFLQNICSKGPINGSPMPLRYQQQKVCSPVMPQVSKPGTQNQRSSSAFLVNPLNAWANSSVCEEVQPGISTRGIRDSGGENRRDLQGSSPSFVTKPEVSSKRLIFGFMPTASDLELTLGLDLNESVTLETPKRVEDPSIFENVAQRDSTLDLESKPMRNDFDLNVQSGQDLEVYCPAESHMIHTSSKQEHEGEISHGWRTPSGAKAVHREEWQTLHTSSNLKNIHEIAITSTVTPIWSANSSFTKLDTHREAPFAENLHLTSANGGMFVAGKSSDVSGLTSCESRSMSVPVLPKARDDSNASSGELCQSSDVKILTQSECAVFSLNLPSKSAMRNLSEETSMTVGRQPGMFSAMLGCSHVFQSDTTEDLKCADVDDGKAAANNVDKHVTEAFEAADILLHLGLGLPAAAIEDHDADDQERALKWLADIIPQEEISGIGAVKADFAIRESTLRGSERPLERVGSRERELDSFEFSVLRLEPINPDTEKVYTPIERLDLAEDCSPHPNLRRRSQRRGRVGKDFQKEMLPSMASLSRQEITEDLQIIEGLVKSATEAMARCSLSPKEEVPWSLPDLSSVKTSGKAKGSRSWKAGKQNGLLRVCSWGESTRRRRMRRQQRSQWMCLPPGV